MEKKHDLKMTGFIIHSVLLSLIGAMVVILIIGTVYALVRPAGSGALFSLGTSGSNSAKAPVQTGSNASPWLDNSVLVYSGVGRLRIPLSDSSVMILSIAFPYPAEDTAFTEEIAAKTNDFRNIAVSYFSSLPADRLKNLNEDDAKRNILKEYNTILRLGKIETIYFSDLLVIPAGD